MSDKGSSPVLVLLMLRRRLAASHAQVANEKYSAAEARDKIERSKVNVGAAAAEIERLEQEIAGHIEAHGLIESELEG